MDIGYAMISGAEMLDGWKQFNDQSIRDGGFVRQELDRILKEKKPCNTT